ncbi:MAG: hypothetical protein ACE5F1_11360 [Planctomycetota bacterium]
MARTMSMDASRPGRPPGMKLCVGAVLVFVTLSFVLHHGALGLGWWADDPYILECAIFEGPIGFFWDPRVYQRLSMDSFTPMVVPSYAVDYALAGLDATWFYAHQLVVLGLVAAGIFLVVQGWSLAAAFAAGALFLTSGPTTITAQTLMTRHYLEGAVWALLCVLLLRCADRPGWRTRLAGLAYMAAALSKEVYVPLVGVAPFLPRAGPRAGLRLSLPLWIALLAYVPLRLYMLAGSPKQWQLPSFEALTPSWWWRGVHAIATILFSAAPIGGHSAWFEIGLIGAGIALLALVLRNGHWLSCSIIAGCSVLSLIPLWSGLNPELYPGYRATLHVAVVCSVAFGYLLARAARIRMLDRRLRPLPALALGLTALLVALRGKSALAEADWKQRRVQSRQIDFLLAESADKVLVCEETTNFWQALSRIRKELRGEATPFVCHMPFDLRGVAARYFRYSAEEERFVDVTSEFRAVREGFESQEGDAEFSVDLRVVRGRLSVELDSGREKATYWLLRGATSNLYERYVVSSKLQAGGFRSPHSWFVRALKVLDNGRWVLSPEWELGLERDQVIHWER